MGDRVNEGAPTSGSVGEHEREAELEQALDEGRLEELPPNHPRGLLGERNPDLRAIDDEFPQDLNAGVSQEMDLPVVWLGTVLAYLLFFPLGYWLLWRNPRFSLRAKIIASIAGAIGIGYVAYRLIQG